MLKMEIEEFNKAMEKLGFRKGMGIYCLPEGKTINIRYGYLNMEVDSYILNQSTPNLHVLPGKGEYDVKFIRGNTWLGDINLGRIYTVYKKNDKPMIWDGSLRVFNGLGEEIKFKLKGGLEK